MLVKFSEALLMQLQEEISGINIRETDAFKRLAAVLKAVRSALNQLKDYITSHPFKDTAEQVNFFKHIKPQFYALRIYYLEKYSIETGLPAGDAETLKNFYRDELRDVERFFKRIPFHYQYYRLGATELDELYFLPGLEVQSVLIPEMPEPDPEFSTNCDYLFSKIRAYEMLQHYLLEKLRDLDPSAAPVKQEPELPGLKWTGDKVNLVEVIYALYFTGQLNNGNADIAVIIQFMEKHLQIDLSRAYRDFIDIRRRKMISPTKYIDQMRESIHKRIDEDLAFNPNKKRFRSMN